MDIDYEKNVSFLIQDVARLMRLAFDRRIKELGLTRSQWFALAFLNRQDGLTQQQLADQMDMERAPLSKTLARLEKNGWITKNSNAEDKRVNKIFLANKAKNIMPELKDEADALLDYILGDLTDENRILFTDILSQAKARLLTEINKPPPTKVGRFDWDT